MSRRGILLYMSYMCVLFMNPMVSVQEISFADGDQVQFAFDIHDTLTIHDPWRGVKEIGFIGVAGLVLFGIVRMFSSVDKAKIKGKSIEGIIAADDNVRSWPCACDAALNFGDARYVISTEMIEFLSDLAKTYDLQVLSNIGPINWQKIQSRYPQVFNAHCVHSGIIIDYAAGHKIKPDAEPYDRFDAECRQINPKTGNPKTVIFVDDKQHNVDAANKRDGWIGILFKDLQQFKAELASLGIVSNDQRVEEQPVTV